MKQILIKDGFPYRNTDVSFDRSIEQIKVLLRKFKCDKIADMVDTGTEARVIAFTNRGRSFMIEFPRTVIQDRSRIIEEKPAIGARIIHDRIKAMLVSVELGFLEFDQAMLPYLVVQGAGGKPTTLEERVKDLKDIGRLFLPGPGVSE